MRRSTAPADAQAEAEARAPRAHEAHAADPAPSRPVGRVAQGTPPVELQRLALQQQTSPDCNPLNVQAVIWLFRAYNAVMGAQADALRAVGLSPSGFNVVMALLNTPGRRLEPCELAERLLVTRPSVTGLIDTLEAKGLVVRLRHPQDRRRVLVQLTNAAEALLEAHFPDHYAMENRLFAGFTADEVDAFVQLLRRIPGATPRDLQPPAHDMQPPAADSRPPAP